MFGEKSAIQPLHFSIIFIVTIYTSGQEHTDFIRMIYRHCFDRHCFGRPINYYHRKILVELRGIIIVTFHT